MQLRHAPVPIKLSREGGPGTRHPRNCDVMINERVIFGLGGFGYIILSHTDKPIS